MLRAVVLGGNRRSPTAAITRCQSEQSLRGSPNVLALRLPFEQNDEFVLRSERRRPPIAEIGHAIARTDTVVLALEGGARGRSLQAQLAGALDVIAPALRPSSASRPPLILLEGLVPPGYTASVVRTRLASAGLEIGRDVVVGVCTFLDQQEAPLLVLGTNDARAACRMREFYAAVAPGVPASVTSLLTAEVLGVAALAAQDTRLAIANELARWCDDHGLDYSALHARLQRRVNGAAPLPRPALGAPSASQCSAAATLWGVTETQGIARQSVLLQARRVNEAAPLFVVERIERLFGDLRGRTVGVLGLTDESHDGAHLRPHALDLLRRLAVRGATVTVHDPRLPESPVRPELPADVELRGLEGTLQSADFVLIAAGHTSFQTLWPRLLALAPEARAVFDACSALPPDATAVIGLPCHQLGNGWKRPDDTAVNFAASCVEAVERGVSNELLQAIRCLNRRFLPDEPPVSFAEVQELLSRWPGIGRLPEPGPVCRPESRDGFLPTLVRFACRTGRRRSLGDRLSDMPQRVSGLLQPRPANPGSWS